VSLHVLLMKYLEIVQLYRVDKYIFMCTKHICLTLNIKFSLMQYKHIPNDVVISFNGLK